MLTDTMSYFALIVFEKSVHARPTLALPANHDRALRPDEHDTRCLIDFFNKEIFSDISDIFQSEGEE